MHRREFVKRSRSSRLGGEKKNRREKPRCPSFFLLFLPLFSSLVPKIIGRSSWRRATSNASEVSSKPRRFRWNVNFSPLPQFFSPPRGGDYSRDSLSFSSSSPSPPAVCHDTIVRCSLQQRVFDFSSRSFNGCNRGWILAYRKGNFKRSPFRSHCRR